MKESHDEGLIPICIEEDAPWPSMGSLMPANTRLLFTYRLRKTYNLSRLFDQNTGPKGGIRDEEDS
jgi:hypothetical protein